MLVWPAMRGGADALPELLHLVLLLRANDLGFAATWVGAGFARGVVQGLPARAFEYPVVD
jgi:hypothetical protein